MKFDADRIITFGRHRGKHIADVPSQYLRWMLSTDIDESQREAIEDELGERDDDTVEKTFGSRQQFQTGGRQGGKTQAMQEEIAARQAFAQQQQQTTSSTTKKKLLELFNEWYRESALRWHPDRQGGSQEGMQAVNDCRDRLKKMIDDSFS